MRSKPGAFRHQVDVYRPSTALDDRGRRTGAATLVLSGLPCSIEQLQALELIRAQRIWAEATHRVRCYQDPSNPFSELHFLAWGLVTLHVGAVVDADNTGQEVELLCKEERQVAGIGGGVAVVGQRPALLYLAANGSLHPIKVNLTATVGPTVGDDSADGYEVGSWWYDLAADKVWICVDAAAGAAVWAQQGPGAAGADGADGAQGPPGVSTKDFIFQPTAMQPLEATAPGWQTVDFGTIVATVAAYDDTTEEYLCGKFVVPNEINSAGTVTFEVHCSPKTGAASCNVGWTFGHAARADGEAVDASYTDEDSGAKAITATTGYQSIQTWTETVANLGWVAGDTVYFRLSRDPSVADDLVGDCYLLAFRVRIPVSGV